MLDRKHKIFQYCVIGSNEQHNYCLRRKNSTSPSTSFTKLIVGFALLSIQAKQNYLLLKTMLTTAPQSISIKTQFLVPFMLKAPSPTIQINTLDWSSLKTYALIHHMLNSIFPTHPKVQAKSWAQHLLTTTFSLSHSFFYFLPATSSLCVCVLRMKLHVCLYVCMWISIILLFFHCC